MDQTAFVIMGFGEKTDHRTKRKLNLDKTYENIIRPAVLDANLKCVRADDIVHSGVIDKPMYEHLLRARVVIADLSTSNENAIYELGVRHALRPHTTIVIAEKKFKFPFDVQHIAIRKYEHQGPGILYDEVVAVRAELTRAIQVILNQPAVDSPVFTFIPDLTPASERKGSRRDARSSATAIATSTEPQKAPLLSELREQALAARAAEDWVTAVARWREAKELAPGDSFLVQQLALATYKSGKPDRVQALLDAHAILGELSPETTSDPETLGLWGAVHKRLFDLREKAGEAAEAERMLTESIRAYGRGWDLRRDHYTGINFAFLLDLRAARTAAERPEDAIADRVWARRVRAEVVGLCEADLGHPSGQDGIFDETGTLDAHETFWRKATLAEAHAGLGHKDEVDALVAWASANSPESWMLGTMTAQIEAVGALLAQAEDGLLAEQVYPEGVTHRVYLVHEARTVVPPKTGQRGCYDVAVWLEAYEPAMLENVEKVSYRLYEDEFGTRVIESSNAASAFRIELRVYGEFTVVARASRPYERALWLTRYLDLPGRPTE